MSIELTQQELADLGAIYHGEGEWTLQENCMMFQVSDEDWIFTAADGTEYCIWMEE